MRDAEHQLQDRLHRMRREAEAELKENAPDHSAAMYAERVIAAIDRVQKRYAKGQNAAALLAMIELADLEATFEAHRYHEQLGMKKPLRERQYFSVEVFGKVRGLLGRAFANPKNAKEGHESVHGTEEEKQARWNSYQAKLKEELRKNPKLSVTDARKKVAEHFGVALKTITRNTENPRK